MKLGLMAEPGPFGNDEPANRLPTKRQMPSDGIVKRQAPMTISAPSIALFTNFKRRHAATALAGPFFAFAMSGTVMAARPKPAGAYDGTWNVVFTTRAGNCSSTNSAPFNVSGRQVSSAGGGKVTGGIGPGGLVAVRISVGLSAADGKGRLVGNSGTGRWRGVISGDRCSGTWQATRS
jgi:hypothetical protein